MTLKQGQGHKDAMNQETPRKVIVMKNLKDLD